MNLPRTELQPDDPDILPPARRRRARRLLAPLDADVRADFLDELAHRASPSFDFFLFSLVSGAVLSIGLLKDIPALLPLRRNCGGGTGMPIAFHFRVDLKAIYDIGRSKSGNEMQ